MRLFLEDGGHIETRPLHALLDVTKFDNVLQRGGGQSEGTQATGQTGTWVYTSYFTHIKEQLSVLFRHIFLFVIEDKPH